MTSKKHSKVLLSDLIDDDLLEAGLDLFREIRGSDPSPEQSEAANMTLVLALACSIAEDASDADAVQDILRFNGAVLAEVAPMLREVLEGPLAANDA